MEEQLRELKGTRNKLEEDVRVEKGNQQTLSFNLNQLKDNINENENESRRLNKEFERFNYEAKRIEQELETLRNEQQEFDIQQRRSQHEQDQFNEQIHLNKVELQRLQQELHGLEKQKLPLKQQHDQFDQRCQIIEQKLRECTQHIQQIEYQLQDLQMDLTQLQQKSSLLELNTEPRQDKVRQLEQQLDIFDHQRVDIERQRRDNELARNRLQQEANKIENSIRKTDDLIDMKRNREEEFEEFIRKLQAEAQEAKEQGIQAKKELDAAEQRTKSFQVKIDRLQSELKNLQDALVEGEQIILGILEEGRMLENEIEAKNSKREQLDQEERNTNKKFHHTVVELDLTEQAQDTLIQKVIMLQTELKQFEDILRRLINERDECAAELECQTQLHEQFEQKLLVEEQQRCETKNAIKQQKQQVQMINDTLDESEAREAAARFAEQQAQVNEARAQTNFVTAQTAVTQAQADLETAPAASVDSVKARVTQCQLTLTQCQTVLTQSTEIHQLKRQEHTAAKVEATQIRTQVQQAKSTLQEKRAELTKQEEEVSVKEHKRDIQKETVNTTIIQVKNKLEKLKNYFKEIDRQVVDNNQIVQNTQSHLEEQNQSINSDIEQVQQPIISSAQEVEQINLQLCRLKQKAHYLDQQNMIKLVENQQILTNKISKLSEQQLNQQYIQKELAIIREKNARIHQAQNQFENANDNMLNASKPIQDLENEQINQQSLLEATQQEQRRIKETHVQIEAKIASQDREKQKCENEIHRLTLAIEQQRCNHSEQQQDIIAFQTKIDVKQCELDMHQQQRMKYEQELITVQTALVDAGREIAQIDECKRAVERDIQQRTVSKQKNEGLIRESTNKLSIVIENLERLRRKYNEKQRVYNLTKNNCLVLANQADNHRTALVDFNQKLILTQNELSERRKKIERLADEIYEVDRNIRIKQAIFTTISHSKTYVPQDINDDEREEDDEYLRQKTEKLSVSSTGRK